MQSFENSNKGIPSAIAKFPFLTRMHPISVGVLNFYFLLEMMPLTHLTSRTRSYTREHL